MTGSLINLPIDRRHARCSEEGAIRLRPSIEIWCYDILGYVPGVVYDWDDTKGHAKLRYAAVMRSDEDAVMLQLAIEAI